jgi:virulence-associated protein VagC
METAKLFASGRSQAVRLPKAFRFQDATRKALKPDQLRRRRDRYAELLCPVG